jgi:TolB-like protein/Tfp pilus assembly protein PilF
LSFFEELKRRNVFRVAIAYLAGAWLLIEVAGTLFPAFGIPDWGVRFIVIVFALGFLPALIISWAYEITPEGVKREKDVVRDASISPLTAKRLDWITIGLIVAALVFLMADRFWMSPRHPEQSVTPIEVATDNMQASEPETIKSHYPPKSIAVLPFVNMSDDASNEYFSDGISEELLNQLTKIPELRVIARTSSFSYKGKDIKVIDLAHELNVNHILEGSVRKDGNQVRITVQLIDALSDTHLWTETYDRTLNDIFVIQDEIAAEVIKQLKITLLDDTLKTTETNTEAYALFLRGRHLSHQGTPEAMEKAVVFLQQVLAIDPNYVAAWTSLAGIYSWQSTAGYQPNDVGFEKAREAVQEALAIDPNNALAHAFLSTIAEVYDGDLMVAARELELALTLEPANPDILNLAGELLRNLSQLDDAIVVGQYSVNGDPVNPKSLYSLGKTYLWAGKLDEAIVSFRTALALSPKYSHANYRIGIALLLKGELEAALAQMQQEQSQRKVLEGQAIVYHALGEKALSDVAFSKLTETFDGEGAYNAAYVLAFRGEADRAFEWLDVAVKNNDNGLAQIANQPEFINIHKDPRWLLFLERIGKSPQQQAAIRFDVILTK